MARHPQAIAFVMAVLLASVPCSAQDTGIPDTVYFGDEGKAYCFPSGDVYVPVYITTDQDIRGLTLGMEFESPDFMPVPDSAGTWGSIFSEDNYLDLTGLIYNANNVDGVPPDTVMVGGAALTKDLPAGKYLFCTIWFTGGVEGQTMIADSSWTPPGNGFWLVSPYGQYYTPHFVGGELALEEGGPMIFPVEPNDVEGNTGSLISFDIEVIGGYPPFSIVLDSMRHTHIGVAMIELPPTSGTNPLTVNWTPRHEQYGQWMAYYTGTDSQDNSIQMSNLIDVYYDGPECGLHIGDVNSDCSYDIDDVVYMINYIFGFGPPPGGDR